jgi:hypothetical protein
MRPFWPFASAFSAPLLALLLASPGCEPTLPPSTPGGTFTIETIFQPSSGISYSVGGVGISGQWVEDGPGATGSASPVAGTTGANALDVFLGSRAPATWHFTWLTPMPGQLPPACVGVNTNVTIDEAQGAGVFGCVQIYIPDALGVSPSAIYLDDPPASVTVSGAPQGSFQSANGMPETQYLDSSGTVVGVASASAISADGTSITGPTPDLSSVTPGEYVGLAGNLAADGSLNVVGGGTVFVRASAPGHPCVHDICPDGVSK